jgi:hypothetical protein
MGVPRVLRRVVHGAASPALEGASEGQQSMGDVMAMLNLLSALKKVDEIDQARVLSATVLAARFQRGRRRLCFCMFWSVSSS